MVGPARSPACAAVKVWCYLPAKCVCVWVRARPGLAWRGGRLVQLYRARVPLAWPLVAARAAAAAASSPAKREPAITRGGVEQCSPWRSPYSP